MVAYIAKITSHDLFKILEGKETVTSWIYV